MLTARDFFLAYFYPSSPFTCIFFENFSRFFPALAMANTGSCIGPQNKIGHPVGCRSSCLKPTEYKEAKKKRKKKTCGKRTCEINNLHGDRVKFVFSSDVILSAWLGSKHQLTNKNPFRHLKMTVVVCVSKANSKSLCTVTGQDHQTWGPGQSRDEYRSTALKAETLSKYTR